MTRGIGDDMRFRDDVVGVGELTVEEIKKERMKSASYTMSYEDIREKARQLARTRGWSGCRSSANRYRIHPLTCIRIRVVCL